MRRPGDKYEVKLVGLVPTHSPTARAFALTTGFFSKPQGGPAGTHRGWVGRTPPPGGPTFERSLLGHEAVSRPRGVLPWPVGRVGHAARMGGPCALRNRKTRRAVALPPPRVTRSLDSGLLWLECANFSAQGNTTRSNMTLARGQLARTEYPCRQ